MEFKDYKSMIEGIVAAPETLATSAIGLLDNLKTDLESLESVKEQLKTQDTKIRDLQDTNTKLFLRVTSIPEQAAPPATADNLLDDLMKTQFNFVNEGDKPNG